MNPGLAYLCPRRHQTAQPCVLSGSRQGAMLPESPGSGPWLPRLPPPEQGWAGGRVGELGLASRA